MNKKQTVYFAIQQGINNVSQKLPLFGKRLSKPAYVRIMVTSKCNLRCRCCSERASKTKDLPAGTIVNIITDLRVWLGPFYLTLGGGEPLMRKDISWLVKSASNHGIRTNLITNGTLLNKDAASQLSESGLDLVSVSLDGIERCTHDYMRGVKGTYDKVLKNVLDSKAMLPTAIATTLTAKNLDEIAPLVEWVKTNKLYGIGFQAFRPNFGILEWGQESSIKEYFSNEFWPKDKEKTSKIILQLIKMKKHGYPILNSQIHLHAISEYFKNPFAHSRLRCAVGKKSFNITPEGKMRICRFTVGDLTCSKSKNVWHSEDAKLARKAIRGCNCTCSVLRCNFDSGFRGDIAKFIGAFRFRI